MVISHLYTVSPDNLVSVPNRQTFDPRRHLGEERVRVTVRVVNHRVAELNEPRKTQKTAYNVTYQLEMEGITDGVDHVNVVLSSDIQALQNRIRKERDVRLGNTSYYYLPSSLP
ncbi:MAG: hypothetical protein SV253_04325 [Halobacteria archaeon]|nr:hypothetical protein [Halobacteria archaeon]